MGNTVEEEEPGTPVTPIEHNEATAVRGDSEPPPEIRSRPTPEFPTPRT